MSPLSSAFAAAISPLRLASTASIFASSAAISVLNSERVVSISPLSSVLAAVPSPLSAASTASIRAPMAAISALSSAFASAISAPVATFSLTALRTAMAMAFACAPGRPARASVSAASSVSNGPSMPPRP